MKIHLLFIVFLLLFFGCAEGNKTEVISSEDEKITKSKMFPAPNFTLTEANALIKLPLHCVETEYPNKLGQTLGGPDDIHPPQQLHPIFYGCFDWHSAVHGYWSMVSLLDAFPALEDADRVKTILKNNITPEKIAQEVEYFEGKHNASYERTYGWAWLLKLAEALHRWEDPMAAELSENMKPLADLIVLKYKDFLPKLVYPIRVGEHTNTAFGLTFAYDYAEIVNDLELKELIASRAKDFYLKDADCPIAWEPSGYDFLSPCLEEIDIMQRVLEPTSFKDWLKQFMPQLLEKNYRLEPGKVSDRTDGKLVHLDGLNFSRAWVLYRLAESDSDLQHLRNNANEHVAYSYPNLVGDSYEGGHWLGSFAIYALQSLQKK